MKGLGFPVVAHQRVALEKSGEALEQVKPGAAKLCNPRNDTTRRRSASSRARKHRTALKSSSRPPSARAGRCRIPLSAPGAMASDGRRCRPRKKPPGGQSRESSGKEFAAGGRRLRRRSAAIMKQRGNSRGIPQGMGSSRRAQSPRPFVRGKQAKPSPKSLNGVSARRIKATRGSWLDDLATRLLFGYIRAMNFSDYIVYAGRKR